MRWERRHGGPSSQGAGAVRNLVSGRWAETVEKVRQRFFAILHREASGDGLQRPPPPPALIVPFADSATLIGGVG